MNKAILLVILSFFAVFDFCSALAGYSNASCPKERGKYIFTCCPGDKDFPYVWMNAYAFVANELPRCNQANVYYTQCDASTIAYLSSTTTLPAFCGNSPISYSSGTPVAPKASGQ